MANAALVADLEQLLMVADRPDLALNAAHNLGRLGESKAIGTDLGLPATEAIAPSLQDSNPFVRGTAAIALGQLGHASAKYVDDIESLLRDADAGVRSQAVRALGTLGKDMAERHQVSIAGLVKDKDPEVRVAATVALRFLGKLDPAAADIAYIIREDRHWVREAGLTTICELGEDAGVAINGLLEILTSKPPNEVLEMTWKAIGHLGKHAGAHAKALAEQLLLIPLAPTTTNQNKSGPGAFPKTGPGAIAAPKADKNIEDAATKCMISIGVHAQTALPELRKQLRGEGMADKRGDEHRHRTLAYKIITGMDRWNELPESEQKDYTTWAEEQKKTQMKTGIAGTS